MKYLILILPLILTECNNQSLVDAQIALAFSCGYRMGQIGITGSMPSLFTDPKDKKGSTDYPTSCPKYKELAAQYGFLLKE